MENFKDVFARAFLMPEKEFKEYVYKVARNGMVDMEEVAEHFHVSKIQASIRGEELGITSRSSIYSK